MRAGNRCLLDDAYPQELLNWSKSVDGVEVPAPDVAASIPVKLLKKCERVIGDARKQLETTLERISQSEALAHKKIKKIVLFVVNRDFGCSPVRMKQLEAGLQQADLEVVCQVGDF